MRQEMTGLWDAVASAGPHAKNLHSTEQGTAVMTAKGQKAFYQQLICTNQQQ